MSATCPHGLTGYCRLCHHEGRTRAAAMPPSECVHLGAETGERRQCPTCRGNVEVKLRACALHGSCSTHKPLSGVACCQGCPDRQTEVPVQPPAPPPRAPGLLRERVIEFPGMPGGRRLNCSVVEWRGDLWFAWREGWTRARLGLGRFDPATGRVFDGRLLDANRGTHDAAAMEDPRLFVLRDELHLMYTGVEWTGRRGDWNSIRTHVCFGRIENGRLEGSHCPALEHRNYWEKNWGFFEDAGALRAVHTSAPHRVLEVGDGRAAFRWEVAHTPAWHPWSLRGGASPVRVGGEWYSFFHGWSDAWGRRRYCVGLYTFDSVPPYRPRRIAPGPLLLPDLADRHLGHGQTPDVIYPGGAVLRDGRWLLVGGYYDAQCRLWEFDAAYLESILGRVDPPEGWAWREGTQDRELWQSVAVADDYGIRGLTLGPSDVVVDVGAHIGSFAYLALTRGAGRVVCVEPHPENAAILRRNLAPWGDRVTVLECAVLGEGGEAKLGLPLGVPHTGGWSAFGGTEGVPVAARTLASILAEHAPGASLVKLDCEGGEWPVLAGDALAGVPRVVGELHPHLPPAGMGLDWARARLESLGFRVRLGPTDGRPEHHFIAER